MNSERYDVVVAGGGSAGVAAAIGARRAGARTLLLERGPCLGGAATMRNVLTYCGIYTRQDPPRQVVYGIAEDVIRGLRAMSAISAPTRFTSVTVIFDPEAVKWVLDSLCAAAGVEVRLLSQVVGAQRDGDRVTAVDVADHQGIRRYRGDAFVDATGEADLAVFAGAQVRYGNGGRVQNGTLGVRFGGIADDAEVSIATMSEAIAVAKQRGAVGPLYADRGLVARLPVSGDVIAYVVDEDYDARDAASYGRALRSAGHQAAAYLAVLRTIPGCADAYIVGTGPEFGTRESRHVVGRYQLSRAEVLRSAKFEDVVALGAWPIEYHPGRGTRPEWEFIADDGHFDIPLRILRSRDTVNLLAAGRVVDGDKGAGGSLRVMGTAFAVGHAAGVAAARQADGRDDADHVAVQRELERQGAFLGR